MNQDQKLISEAYSAVANADQKLAQAGWKRPYRFGSGTSADIPPHEKNGRFLYQDWDTGQWILQYAPGFSAPRGTFATLDDALKADEMNNEAYAPGFAGASQFRKGAIVKLPRGWQKQRGYLADWAKDVTHGRVWGHVIDRNIHMTGDVEVTLIDPYTREDLGQGLAFRPDELTLESLEPLDEATHPSAERIAELRVKIGQLFKMSKSEKVINMTLDRMTEILDKALTTARIFDPAPPPARKYPEFE